MMTAVKPENRYDVREEEDGTWTVYDTRPNHDGDSRIMYGIAEKRARQYVERLNSTRASASESNDEHQE